MGLNNFILECEKQNKELSKDVEYYKNKSKRLEIQLKKQKEIIDKAKNKLNSFIDCCKAEKLESGSDYLHHQYWDMFERFNKQIKEILEDKEVK